MLFYEGMAQGSKWSRNCERYSECGNVWTFDGSITTQCDYAADVGNDFGGSSWSPNGRMLIGYGNEKRMWMLFADRDVTRVFSMHYPVDDGGGNRNGDSDSDSDGNGDSDGDGDSDSDSDSNSDSDGDSDWNDVLPGTERRGAYHIEWAPDSSMFASLQYETVAADGRSIMGSDVAIWSVCESSMEIKMVHNFGLVDPHGWVAWAPNGSAIAFSDKNVVYPVWRQTISVCSTQEPFQKINTLVLPEYVDYENDTVRNGGQYGWSADSTHYAIMGNTSVIIWNVRENSMRLIQVGGGWGAAWSPVGAQLAVASSAKNRGTIDIYEIDCSGTGVFAKKKLTLSMLDEPIDYCQIRGLDWSQCGNYVAVTLPNSGSRIASGVVFQVMPSKLKRVYRYEVEGNQYEWLPDARFSHTTRRIVTVAHVGAWTDASHRRLPASPARSRVQRAAIGLWGRLGASLTLGVAAAIAAAAAAAGEHGTNYKLEKPKP